MHPEDNPVRKGRGKGKKPAMVIANIRIPSELAAFYKRYEVPTQKMRDVLAEYAARNTTL